MSRVRLIDTEVSAFGRHEGHGLVECAAASVYALRSRQPWLSIVDSIWLGSARPGESERWESGLAAAVAQASGLGGPGATDVHAFCASANVAFIHAAREVSAGLTDIALVVGVEHMSAYRGGGPLVPPAVPSWARLLSPPAFYGLCASRYLHDYGLEPDLLAEISVRNRRAAVTNPKARFPFAVSKGEVLASKTISEPLTLLQCSAPADGSGAALLVSDAAAARLGLPDDPWVEVAGVGHATAHQPDVVALTSFPEDMAAAAQAYRAAGIAPDDVDVVELHDAFTIAQAIHLEDLGLAGRGQGWRAGAEDEPRLVINPSGGLLGRGHPLGATGIAQLDSIRRALTHTPATVGLVHEAGGIQHLSQLLSTAIVLRSRAGSRSAAEGGSRAGH